MPLQTTVIGSYPKPDYLKDLLPDWFQNQANYDPEEYGKALEGLQQEDWQLIDKAVKEVIDKQCEIGIDVITDGEIVRENYIYHFCRKIKGFDFHNTLCKSIRNGACKMKTAVIIQKVEPLEPRSWCHKDWEKIQRISERPVKYTIPGPMTILGSTHLDAPDAYKSVRQVSEDLVRIINREVLALDAAGCKYIQVDEPLLVRQPEIAMDYGIEHLKQCFQGVSSNVVKVIHLCCGYPSYLDQEGYLKADKDNYRRLAEKLDEAGFDQVSIEDAHRYNDLELFAKFKKSSIIVGVVKVASSKVETREEIHARVSDILKHVPSERLILAPDCGLGFLVDDNIRTSKLKNMVAVAKSL